MARVTSFDLQINGVTQSITNVTELETAIQDLNNQLNSAQFGTQQFQDLQRTLASATTQMNHVQTAIQGISQEQKLEAIGKVGESIAGGFGLATASAGIFGKQLGLTTQEVEEYQKSAESVILGLQSYKSLMEGITGENLKNIKTMIGLKLQYLQTALASTKASLGARLFGTATRAAIASTGIGLLVIALGLVIQNFDKIKESASSFAARIQPRIDALVERFVALKDGARDFLSTITFGLVDDAKKARETARKEEKIATNKKKLEKLAEEEDFYKRSLELTNRGEAEKLKAILDYEKKKFEATRLAYKTNTKEYKDQHFKVLEAEKALQDQILKDQEEASKKRKESADKAREKELKDWENHMKRFANIENLQGINRFKIDVEPVLPKLEDVLGQDKDRFKLEFTPTIKEIPLDQVETHVSALNKAITNTLVDMQDGRIDENALDQLFGEGFQERFTNSIQNLAVLEEAVFGQMREARIAQIENQLAETDILIEDAKEQVELLTESLDESQTRSEDLQEQLLNATGEKRALLIEQLERERLIQADLNDKRLKEDARQKKAEQEKIQLEKKKQEAINKTNKLQAIGATIEKTLTAALAIRSAVQAVAGANALPFPANLVAIVAALAATASAIATAKGMGKGFAVGGFTGNGSDSEVAGEVHKNEYVINANQVRKNPSLVQALENNRLGLTKTVETQSDKTNQLILNKLNDIHNSNIQVANRRISVGVDQITSVSERVTQIKANALK